MKFIHTADIHWGMIPDSDKPWGKKREQAIRLTFQGIIEDARDSRADLLLISGDLFHRQPLARDLKEVNYLFSTIPGTRVVIIAGNHDRIRKSSALLSFTWAPNVTFLMGEELSSVYFEELNTEVYGFSYHTAEIIEAKADNISLPASRRTRILMLHGGDAKHVPFDRNALAASPFSYIALGHIHKPEILLENRMAYAGSPEPLDMTETGPHGYFIGEIDTTSGHVTSLQFKEVCQAQYIPLVVNVTPRLRIPNSPRSSPTRSASAVPTISTGSGSAACGTRISALTWIFSPVSGISSRSWTSRSHSMISTHCSRNIQAT